MSQIDSTTTTPNRNEADAAWIEKYNEERTEPAVPITEGDYAKLYAESQAQLATMTNLVAAARLGSPAQSGASTKAPTTAERVRAMVGELPFQQMSRAERLTSVGVDPSVSDEFLTKVFGRGNNGTIGRDLFRTDPARYNRLREASKILNLYCA